jgi:hypothetical protein
LSLNFFVGKRRFLKSTPGLALVLGLLDYRPPVPRTTVSGATSGVHDLRAPAAFVVVVDVVVS